MLAAFLAAIVFGTPATPSDTLARTLRAVDQALLDAIGPGDRPVWDGTLAASAIYVDENGKIYKRRAFLEQLKPFPAHVTGSLRISAYEIHAFGDLATVVHTDEESEDYHGQTLHARYLTTETWHLVNGAWRLFLIHVFAIPRDPPAITITKARLRSYVGHYRAAPGIDYVVRLRDSTLRGGRAGATETALYAEAPDVFFTPGLPRSRTIFQRDAADHVTGFVDRREGRDLYWERRP